MVWLNKLCLSKLVWLQPAFVTLYGVFIASQQVVKSS